MQKKNIFKKISLIFMGLSLFFAMALFSCNNEASTPTTETPTDSVTTPAPPAPTPPDTTTKQAVTDTTKKDIDTSKTNQNPPPPKTKN